MLKLGNSIDKSKDCSKSVHISDKINQNKCNGERDVNRKNSFLRKHKSNQNGIIKNIGNVSAQMTGSLSNVKEKLLKEKANKFVINDDDDDVIIIHRNQTTLPNESKKKKVKLNKRTLFYGKYNKKNNVCLVHRKILNGFGIAGIDKKVDGRDKKHNPNASEIEWNGHLNSIISRLNSQNTEKVSSESLRCGGFLVKCDSVNKPKELKETFDTTIKMSPIKNSFKYMETNLKRKNSDDWFECSNDSLKRKKLERKNKSFSENVTFSNVDFTANRNEKSPKAHSNIKKISLISDKTLGGIVDDDEIIQRYLNGSKNNDDARCIIGKKKEQLNSPDQSSEFYKTKPTKRSQSLNDLMVPIVCNRTSENSMKYEPFNKSCTNNTVSDVWYEESSSSEEDELQADIMADMLNNVSNEIMIVGSTLCSSTYSTKQNKSVVNNGIRSLNYSTCNHKNYKPCDSSVVSSVNNNSPIEKHVIENKGKNNVMIPDSDEEVNSVKRIVTKPSPNKTDKSAIQSEKEISIKNCKVVIENFAPLMFQSIGNSIKLNSCKDGNKKLININPDSNVVSKISEKKEDYPAPDNIKKETNKTALMRPTLNELSGFACKKESSGFEGFTEQDILILTVKLALFKINSCKYNIGFSSSSLYHIDGKQILIKDVSQENEFSSWESKSSKGRISSSVQTENDIPVVTPSPGSSRIRPISIAKLRGIEKANEKFMQNDVLDTRDPLTPITPQEQEEGLSPVSHVERLTPVSRRQLSFLSPSLERTSQPQEIETKPCSSKEVNRECNSTANDDWQVLHYRMQYTMPSSSEDTAIRSTRLTFTTCRLNCKETALVTKLANITNSCLTKDFTHNTTHLIIGATGRGSLEYYLAIAYRAFIVSMDWVSLCLALNKILPVTGFIPTEDEGPLKCLEPISPPFVGFFMCSKILPSANNNYPIAEITKTLLSLGGARLLTDIDAFQKLRDVHFPRFFVYGADSQITQAVIDKCASMHIVPVQFVWVYESISAFRALPVMDYLGTAIHSRTLIRDYRIPEQLACSRYPRLEGNLHPQILDERYQRSL